MGRIRIDAYYTEDLWSAAACCRFIDRDLSLPKAATSWRTAYKTLLNLIAEGYP